MPKLNIKPIGKISIDQIATFWSHVDIRSEDECWPWKFGTTDRGYGRCRVNYIEYRAHRIAFFLFYGFDPELLVCHSCDNPPCCNPKHLFKGTNKDNADDCVNKGRQSHNGHGPSGEHHGRAKLNWKSVAEIRAKYSGGQSQISLGLEYGVSKSTIGYVVHNEIWHIHTE